MPWVSNPGNLVFSQTTPKEYLNNSKSEILALNSVFPVLAGFLSTFRGLLQRFISILLVSNSEMSLTSETYESNRQCNFKGKSGLEDFKRKTFELEYERTEFFRDGSRER